MHLNRVCPTRYRRQHCLRDARDARDAQWMHCTAQIDLGEWGLPHFPGVAAGRQDHTNN